MAFQGTGVGEALVSAGLLPNGHSLSIPPDARGSGHDVLPALADAWHTVPVPATGTKGVRARGLLQWLTRQATEGAKLTIGIPGSCSDAVTDWLGRRLAWWPHGIPEGKRIGLVSSRLGRKLDSRNEWFAALRAACTYTDPRSEILLTAATTAAARFVERCACLFGLRVLRISIEDDTDTFAQWGRRILDLESSDPTDALAEVVLSPPLEQASHAAGSERFGELPIRDRAVVAMSELLRVFHIRRNGNLHRLVDARLSDPAWPVGSVCVSVHPELVAADIAGSFQDKGAVGWIVWNGRVDEDTSTLLRPSGASVAVVAHQDATETPPSESVSIQSLPPADDWQFLTHWTRQRHGPWPDQAEQDYLDDLILARSDHSALAALCRIVHRQRLIASGRSIRGGFRVVSFTAVPLAELCHLRVFRTHRGRWDFERYGICIRRDWLEQRGARPVQYGDDDLWAATAPDDRPFFQLAKTRSRSGSAPIDWSVEREWRHVGDVDLSDLPPDAALLFVPTEAEARQLARICRWPVTVVPPHG